MIVGMTLMRPVTSIVAMTLVFACSAIGAPPIKAPVKAPTPTLPRAPTAPRGPTAGANVVRQLDAPPTSVAMSESGVLMTITGEQVLLYDRIPVTGPIPAAKKIAVGAGPRSVVYKKLGTQELFIVCCGGDRSIWLLDGRTGKLIRKIAVPGGTPSRVIASASPDCDVAYVGLDLPVGTIARLDLKAFKVGEILQGSAGNLSAGTASSDGKYIYPANEYENLVNNLTPWLVPPTGTAVTQLRNRKINPGGMMQVDASGRWGIAGSVVTDLAMQRQIALIKGLSLLTLPDDPVVISIEKNEIVATSINTWAELKRLPLPADFIPPLTKETLSRDELSMYQYNEGRVSLQEVAYQRVENRAAQKGLPPVWAFYDRTSKALVLINEKHVAAMPLASFALAKEPDLGFAIDASDRVPVGKPWKATIKGNAKAEISVVEGPPGMTVDGQSLNFTATTGYIGPAALTVRATIGEVYHDEMMQLTVSRPSVNIGNALADRFAVSPDGKKLIVRGRVNDERGSTWRFTLIDLDTFTTIATRDLSAAVQPDSLAMSNDLVLMASADSDALLSLSAKDLSDAGRTFTKGRAGRLLVIGDELYAAAAQSDRPADSPNLIRYKLPELKEDGRYEPYVYYNAFDDRNDPEHSRVPYRVREGTYYGGVVYGDEALTKPKLIVTAIGFLQGTNIQVPFLPNRWGVELRPGEGLTRSGGQLLRTIPGYNWPNYIIHPDVPLLLIPGSSSAQPLPNDRRVVQKFELLAHDLSDGDLAGSVTIAQENVEDSGMGAMALSMTPRGPVVAVRDRIYLIDDVDVKAIKTKPPLMVYPKTPTIVLSGMQPQKLEHVAENAEGGVKWALKFADPAVTVDEKTGTVTIEPEKLASALPQLLVDWATAWTSHRMIDGSTWETKHTRPPPPNILVDNYIKAAGERATILFGKTITGLPSSVAIYLEATDGRGRTSMTYYTVFIEVPKADVMKYFK